MKHLISTLSIFISSSATFITQLLAVWILAREDPRTLLVLGAFMPFGFALSSASDSLRACSLPIISGAGEEGKEEANSSIRTLLLVVVLVFFVLLGCGVLLRPLLESYTSLPKIAFLDLYNLFLAMTIAFGCITCSSIFTTYLYAQEKNFTATAIILMSNVLQVCGVYYFASHGYGVHALVYAAFMASIISAATVLSLSGEVRAVIAPFSVAWDQLGSQTRRIFSIAGPIFSSYGLLIVWMFYLTHVLLDFSEVTVAAFPLYVRVQNVIIMLSIAVGVAQAIQYNKRVANFEYSQLKTDTRNYTLLSFFYQLVPVALIFIFAEKIGGLLVSDQLVADEIALYLRTVAPGLAILSTYVGMTVYLEQTERSRRAFIYNMVFIVCEIAVIEYVRRFLIESSELYVLLSIVFAASAVFIAFEMVKTRYEFNLQQKMQGITL